MSEVHGWEHKRVLVTVKTYPTPSAKYQETVCTAGITSDGEWIRLYPIAFRHCPYDQWYKKYQWIETMARRKRNDPRPETYEPNMSTFKVGEWVDSKDGWQARKAVVLPTAVESLHDLEATGASLGVFKPAEVLDFTWETDSSDWTERQKNILAQGSLFERGNKPLEKIPWVFRYDYRCSDPSCPGHRQQILDWELYEGYRSWAQVWRGAAGPRKAEGEVARRDVEG